MERLDRRSTPPLNDNDARYAGSQRQHHPQRAGGRGGKPDPWLVGTAPACTTALAMSRDEARLDKLSFGCPNLDAAFDGGVRVQGITEASLVCGNCG